MQITNHVIKEIDPLRKKSVELTTRGKKPIVPLPITDIRYDRLGHWPISATQKKIVAYCKMTCCMKCEKCNIYLCLIDGRNCFKDFHSE